jgi:succinate dehydrogenase / fumarate reductase cytochrome b subunit
MLGWLIRTASSSIGKKALMALTGLLLIGFLVVHLAGNLTFYMDGDGAAFDSYAETLESNPLLPLAEFGLLVLFVTHIVLALRVTKQNRDARKSRYAVRATAGGSTAGSRSMVITGIVLLVFLVVHIMDFRLQNDGTESMAALVREELSAPLGAGLYAVAMLALGLHVSHAFKSAMQTLGCNHPKYTPLIEKASLGLGIVLGLGFLSFPLVIFFMGGSAAGGQA